MAPNPFLLTCPSSRGIGLALTRRLLVKTTLPVVATARSDLEGTRGRILDGLDVDGTRLEVLRVDVTDEPSIASAATHLKSLFPPTSHYLHLSFLLPGILHPEKSPAQISAASALETLKINTLGPMLLAKHLEPFLPRKKTELFKPPNSPSSPNKSPTDSPPNALLPQTPTLALLSARVGSISDNQLGGWYSYRCSKAAVNQLAKSLDIYLRNMAGDKCMAISMHPGTVKTGLSKEFWGSVKPEKLFSEEFAAERLIEVVRGLGVEGRGRCWGWDAVEIPP